MKKYHASLAATLLAALLITQNAQAGTKYNELLVKHLSEMAVRQAHSGHPFRVFIIDGVRDVDVNAFLKSHFENVQNVMFTNVIVTDKQGKPMRDKRTGGIVVESDDC